MDLTVTKLCKSYGVQPVLRDVSFLAREGAVTCLTAPSGWGKTTLLRILMGLETPDGGKAEGLCGLRRSAVFQEDRLLEGASAAENLRFVQGRDFTPRTAGELLRELGLDPGDKKPVREYSGGMRRRVALARALCVSFDLLFLDEPFSGLDRENRERAAECLLGRGRGKTILLVTHELQDAALLGAEVVDLTK